LHAIIFLDLKRVEPVKGNSISELVVGGGDQTGAAGLSGEYSRHAFPHVACNPLAHLACVDAGAYFLKEPRRIPMKVLGNCLKAEYDEHV
jgi:hypothetical protein